VDVSGVTVAYTVRAMDAGPVIAFERVNIDPNIKVCYRDPLCHVDMLPASEDV